MNMSNNSSSSSSYDGVSCSVTLQTFQSAFNSVYGPLACAICITSILTNVCNTMVLSHKQMISPTNCLLTGIAVSDLVKVVTLLPMLLRFRVLPDQISISLAKQDEVSHPFWAYYYLFSSLVTLTAHTAALWIAVVLSLFRYLCIKFYAHPQIKLWFSVQRAKLFILIIYVIVVCLLGPYYSTVHVIKNTYTLSSLSHNETVYLYQGTVRQGTKLENYGFWITSIVGKLLPCFVMSLFGFLLINTLNSSQELSNTVANTNNSSNLSRKARRNKEHRRTTTMLITIITMYAVTEIPNAILALISQYNNYVELCIYSSLGEFLDFIALLNNSVNFVLYCMMSTKFREIFVSMFGCLLPSRFLLSEDNVTMTTNTTTLPMTSTGRVKKLNTEFSNGPNAWENKELISTC